MQKIITETAEILLTEKEFLEMLHKHFDEKLKNITFITNYSGTKEIIIKGEI